MKKGKEEVGYLMLMDGNMDEKLCPTDEKTGLVRVFMGGKAPGSH